MTGELRPTIVELADMALSMHQETSVHSTAESVLTYIKAAVGADYAGALLIGPKNTIESVAGSDPIVAEADAMQERLGEGPDLTLLDGAQCLTIADTFDEKRWPLWAQAAADLGLRSLISVKLSTHDRVYGSINVYSARPHAFAEDDRSVVLALARHAAIALSTSLQEQHLNAAIDSRKLIGQAQGILMERFSLSSEQAFAVLLRYSQHTNTKLRAVAEQVVEDRALPIDPS